MSRDKESANERPRKNSFNCVRALRLGANKTPSRQDWTWTDGRVVSYVVDRTRSPKPTPRGSMSMAPAPVPSLTLARDDTSIWHARPALTTDDIRRTGSRHSWALTSDSVVMDGKSSGRGRNQEGSDGDTASSDGRARHTHSCLWNMPAGRGRALKRLGDETGASGLARADVHSLAVAPIPPKDKSDQIAPCTRCRDKVCPANRVLTF